MNNGLYLAIVATLAVWGCALSKTEPKPVLEISQDKMEPIIVAVDPEPEPDYSLEAEYIAKTIYGEARGCTPEEQEQVIWCILNRVDDPRFPDDIISVITAPNQFHGYWESNPVWPEHYELALDVLYRWELEKAGGDSERNLGPTYLYFHGDGRHNYFREEY